MTAVSQAIAEGDTTDKAMAAAGKYFPPGARELVSVGEESGRLAEVFGKLATHYEHMLGLRRMLVAALVWPAIQLTIAVFIVGLLILLMGLIGDMTGQPIDILGLGLLGPRGLVIYLIGVAAAVVLGVLVILAWQREWLLGRAMAWVAERTPVVGHALKMLGLTRFTWSLAMTTGTGMEVRRAVSLAIGGSQWGPLRARREMIDARLAAGGDIHDALCEARGVLPEDLLHAVAVGEEAGSLSETLEGLSAEYAQRAKVASTAMTTVAGVLIWCLVGAVIIALIFRIAMFYIGTINDLANGKF